MNQAVIIQSNQREIVLVPFYNYDSDNAKL